MTAMVQKFWSDQAGAAIEYRGVAAGFPQSLN
jgi:Flp pilus assembly pilin Flp